MRIVAGACALFLLAACNPDAETTNPAIATEEGQMDRAATAPAAGASSFTQEQARGRLENQGFSNISSLTQDESGLWRGSATMNGQVLNVAVDYQGNVTTEARGAAQ